MLEPQNSCSLLQRICVPLQFDEASALSKQQEQQIADLKTQLTTTQQLLKDSETAATAAAAQVNHNLVFM
jgi:hypothetical protein